jgi:hypothetical protein
MKTLKVIQNTTGKFNLFGGEENLSFILVIQEDGNTITNGELRAELRFSGDAEKKNDFDYYLENMDIGELFKECYEYGSRVISNTDYKAQCLLFAKIYKENFEEIQSNWLKSKDERLEREIAQLQSEVGVLPKYFDLDYFNDNFKNKIEDEKEMYVRWLTSEKEQRNQYIDRSEAALKSDKRISEYQSKVDELSELLKD